MIMGDRESPRPLRAPARVIRSNSIGNDPILLNEVAASIWEHAENGKTCDEILKTIICSYNLEIDSPQTLSVEHFILQMVNMGLLISSDKGGSNCG